MRQSDLKNSVHLHGLNSDLRSEHAAADIGYVLVDSPQRHAKIMHGIHCAEAHTQMLTLAVIGNNIRFQTVIFEKLFRFPERVLVSPYQVINIPSFESRTA